MAKAPCLPAIAAGALFGAIATGAAAAPLDDCLQSDDWALRVAGCTVVIDRHLWDGIDPATAYHNRGSAHRALGALEDALADFERAERLDPSYARLYQRLGAMAALSQRLTGQPTTPLCACETPAAPAF